MKSSPSTYYPPRSRWYQRWRIPFYRLRYRIETFRDALLLPGAWTPGVLNLGALVKSLLLPGYVFFTMDQRVRWVGSAILAGYGLLLLIFLAGLGTPLSNVAYGLMIALHATSICYALEQMADGGLPLLRRVGLALIVLVIMGGVVYRLLLGQMQAHLFMPIRLHDRIYVVKTFTKPDTIRRGSQVVYKLDPSHHYRIMPGTHYNIYDRFLTWGGGTYIRGGFSAGKVLAEGGDNVKFTSEGMYVNGAMLPRNALMPTQKALIMPERHWFIWPEFDMYMRGTVLSDLYFRLAMVSQDRFVGTLCKRWFWRRMDL